MKKEHHKISNPSTAGSSTMDSSTAGSSTMDSSTANTMVLNKPNPPFPSPHRTVDFSPLEFILGLIAVMTIPALVYSFFFAIKCPPNLYRLWRRSSGRLSGAAATAAAANITIPKDVAVDVRYNKDEHFKDVGGECPVCLSVFGDGEEVRQLSACKHSFHVSCIDMWLYSHSNCPVCRASVTVKRPNSNGNGNGNRTTAFRNDDFQQGLPDAGSLV